MSITPIAEAEYPAVVEIWEASVRATHHFLTEADIQFFKPLILAEYLGQVDLAGLRDPSGNLVGFVGVADHKIEMLFMHPDLFGKGLGKKLLRYAVDHWKATKVDVNEDNPQAVGFYQRMGFRTISRSALDPSGKPFPILHLELENTNEA